MKRKKYYFLLFFSILFTIWLFCLPKQLFNTPHSTIITDYNGNLIGAKIAKDGQWRFPHNSSVPYKFKEAIIQFEDRTFEQHFGISFKAIGRAIYQNIAEGEVVSGGSTITMQVIRMSRNKQRTYWQKIIEMFMATRLEVKYSKDEILALYASNAPMGGNVVGIDAAAWRYFNRPPSQLSWAESCLLAVLPNAPSLLHLGKNRDALKLKRNRLLKRLLSIGKINHTTYNLAIEEPIPDEPKDLPQIAPHLLSLAIKEGYQGKKIKSTIHKQLQDHTNQVVKIHHNRLKQNEIYNAAIIIGNLKTGEIISYVGNTNVKEEEHGGNVDIIQAPRSSGSILKPFLYQFALENGNITPYQLLPDVPISMSGYSPVNYSKHYDGAVPANEALSRSLNIPFVLMLQDYGVQKFKDKLTKTGITTITKPANHYGLSLILGGAETKLIDLINSYGNLANSVSENPPLNSFKYTTNNNKPAEQKEINKGAAWFTINALKEVKRPYNQTNWKTYSSSRNIAWKTGTSYGFRDAWAIGFDNNYIVGVWVGNADGEGRPGIIGIDAAAPILFDVFDGLPPTSFFKKPIDELKKIDICSVSGFKASKACSVSAKKEIPFASNLNKTCPYHHKIFLDSTKKEQVNSSCYQVDKLVDTSWFMLPPKMELYYKKRNPLYTPPPQFAISCKGLQNQNTMDFLYPKHNSEIVIPTNFNKKKEKIILEATHKTKEATMYWHLNEKYIGKTQGIHQLEVTPAIGSYTLAIMDNFGETHQIKFKVVK